MWKLCKVSGVVCAAVLLQATLCAGAAQAGPERGEPQYGGTVNILTRLAALNALSFNQYDWPWKTNHDALFLEHLAKGDLDFGPRGAGENPFKSLSYIPDSQLTGELAESWSVEENPLRLVFNIRQGVYWPAKEGVMERRELVAEDLLVPAFKISMFEAIGRRLQRNYAFITTIILTAWITKILIHPPPGEEISSLSSLYSALSVGAFPSWFVAMIMLGTFVAVTAVTIYIAKNSTGEITEVGKSSRTNWMG